MITLNESRSKSLTKSEEKVFSRKLQDSASRDLTEKVFQAGSRLDTTDLGILPTEISSVALTPNLFMFAIESSVKWQGHYLRFIVRIKSNESEEGRKKLADLKANVFDPRTQKERVARALKLLSEIKPIEGLNKETWKSIVEETALEDTYGD